LRRRKLDARLTVVEEMLDRVDRNIERIEIVTMVREPNTSISADAYDGLRKQVIASAGERAAHLHQLAQFDSALRAGASAEELGRLVREWIGQASLLVVEDTDVPDAFEFVGPARATGVRVSRPAYVDRVSGRIVRKGIAERVEEPDASGANGAGQLPDEREPSASAATNSGGTR
jgi:hypothetical protein